MKTFKNTCEIVLTVNILFLMVAMVAVSAFGRWAKPPEAGLPHSGMDRYSGTSKALGKGDDSLWFPSVSVDPCD